MAISIITTGTDLGVRTVVRTVKDRYGKMAPTKHAGPMRSMWWYGPKKGGGHWSGFYTHRKKKASDYDEGTIFLFRRFIIKCSHGLLMVDGNKIEKFYYPEAHAKMHEGPQQYAQVTHRTP